MGRVTTHRGALGMLAAFLVMGCGQETAEEATLPVPDATPAPEIYSEICINEVMASNAFTIADETGARRDWIELYNSGDEEVDLGGYYITDDFADRTRHELAEGLTLAAGDYLLLWADGMTELGADHIPFSLAAEGEEIGLFGPDRNPISAIRYGRQVTDWSAARVPDGSSDWVITGGPTPGESNGEP